MKNLVALIAAGTSAYSFSFAIDLLLGGLLGVYPSTAFLPVVTWSAIATITGVVALRLAPRGRLLVIPFVGLALLAFLGGVVGHRYSLIVGIAMLAQAIGVWLATARVRSSESSKRPKQELGAEEHTSTDGMEETNMRPLGNSTEEPLSKAEVVGSSLVELCKRISPRFREGLLGKDISTTSQAPIESVSLEVLLFALHLTDRLTFIHLGVDGRTVFMEALLPATKRLLQPPFDANLANLCEVRQQFYGGFAKLYADDNESLKGTLFWEFGKALAAVYSDGNPVAATVTSMAGMDLLKVINEALLSAGVICG